MHWYTIRVMTTQTTVQLRKARTEKEPGLYKIMTEKMKNHHRYFSLAEIVAPVSRVSITKKEMKTCPECEFENITTQSYVRVTKRMVGNQTLGARMKLYRAVLPSSTSERLDDYYAHLVDGLLKLKEAKIVHFNIQSRNIMYSATMFLPVITDFGDAFFLDDLYDLDTMVKVFSKPHPVNRCIEAVLISAIHETVDWQTTKINVVALKKVIVERTQNDTTTEQKWTTHIETQEGTEGKVVVDDLLKNWHTWDMYSLDHIFRELRHKPST